MTEAAPGRRQRIVEVAHGWADSLIDQTGRNQLLFCRDRGKLLLDEVPDVARLKLMAGRKVRLTELFPEPEEHARAAKVLEKIRGRVKEYDEEQGIRVGRLASAFASWKDRKDRTVRAPVLLRDVEISRGAAGFGDHDITVNPDVELNPVLLAHLDSTFKVAVDGVVVNELSELEDEIALEQLRAIYAAVPEFRIEPGLLIGTFHYAKLAMFEDLRANAEAYAEGDLFAAIAGDQDAILALRQPVGDVTRDLPDRTPPGEEFLVLDADPSQSYAINAAVAGRSIVIEGPPGTGKSQTIANLISTLTAQGKRVLFVAEKRAAIDAVLGRLTRVGLDGLILDLHANTANRGAVYAQIRSALEAARQTRPVDQRDLHDRVTRARDALLRHVQSLHSERKPWGTTVFDLQASLLGTPAAARTPMRMAGDGLTRAGLDEARQLLGDLVGIDGLLPVPQRGPWGAAVLESIGQAAAARDAVQALLGELPAAQSEVATLAAALGVATPATPGRGAWLVELCRTTSRLQGLWRDELWQHDLAALLVATGDRGYRRASSERLGLLQRLRLRRLARGLRREPGGALHQELAELATLRDEWRALGHATPGVATTVDDDALGQVIGHLTTLRTAFGTSRWADATWPDLAARLEELAADPLGPVRTAQTREWSARLRAMGLAPLLTWLARELPGWPADERRELAEASLGYAWRSTVLGEIRTHDLVLGTFNDRNHRAVAAQFVKADREHIESTAERIRRLLAERLYQVRNAHGDQEVFLDKELPRKRRLKPLREIVAGAPDILLAAKPCWAMSPLLVSQMLPPRQLFDVVIFDEASQVLPADAVTSLARARSAVVAGDSKQLPPTSFFDERGDEDEDDDESLGADVESILDAVNRALGQSLAHEYALGWHYRSEDERLIAFSNAHFYDNRLTTFPGTAVESPLSLEVAESPPGASSGTDDAAVVAEVARVVELALRHARDRPGDSLGIIALSLKHAQRIEEALHDRLRNQPSLRAFFADDRDEPYFVKNLERVQGDERDAIILSVGFGRVNGRLLRRFGPLNLAGGERRLNVAITRARRRMTVVASFRPDELDPDSVTAGGARALAQFLRYADTGGVVPSTVDNGRRALNAFEIAVRDGLTGAGLDVIAQWGVTGDHIDFVVRHPHRTDQMVLAIEADGPAYHATETTRARDRLRQEHLERLGWRFHRIWSTEWFDNRDSAVAAVLAAYEQAVTRADAPLPATPAVTEPPAPAVPAQPTAQGPRPQIVPGTPITSYRPADLVRILDWIRSDGGLRTDEELLREASQLLGFSRIGPKIRASLTDAIGRLHR